jgi:hypothetical protein
MCAYTLEQLLGYRDLGVFKGTHQTETPNNKVEKQGVFSWSSVLWTEIPCSCGRENEISCAQFLSESLVNSPVLQDLVGGSGTVTIAVSVESDDYEDKYSYVGISFGRAAIGFQVQSQNSGEAPVRNVKMLTLEPGKKIEEREVLEHSRDMDLFWEVVVVAQKIDKNDWKKTDLVCRTGSS